MRCPPYGNQRTMSRLEGVISFDAEAFETYLKRGGRSPAARSRCVSKVTEYDRFLFDNREGRNLDGASLQDLEAYVLPVERMQGASAKTDLWAITYYYDYAGNHDMKQVAGALRQQRIKRKPFALKDFRGSRPADTESLAKIGISNGDQMLRAGRTPGDRLRISEQAGISLEIVEEYVQLSDLARIPGVKSVRARLYLDAGIGSVQAMARWDPVALRTMLLAFVEETEFDGIAPLPKEAEFTVKTAKALPVIVEV